MPSVAPDVIPRDLPCITCGYNLRTQPTTAHCPECDTPAAQTFQAYATRLAGADRRWLRKLTSAAAWLTLSMLIPAIFAFVRLPEFKDHGEWLTDDRQALALVMLPYACALVACWHLGAKEPNPRPGETDQPITRWALRLTALLWIIPIVFSAGPFQKVSGSRWLARYGWHDPDYWFNPAFRTTLLILSASGVVATVLLFRRLKHLARRIPSRVLVHQCNVIGSQLPIATLLIASWDRYSRLPEAISYAITTPLPGPGLPWPIALSANQLDTTGWAYLLRYPRHLDPEFLLATWAILITVATLFLAIQFLIALIRVRRADHQLTTYSRELLSSQPSKWGVTGEAEEGMAPGAKREEHQAELEA